MEQWTLKRNTNKKHWCIEFAHLCGLGPFAMASFNVRWLNMALGRDGCHWLCPIGNHLRLWTRQWAEAIDILSLSTLSHSMRKVLSTLFLFVCFWGLKTLKVFFKASLIALWVKNLPAIHETGDACSIPGSGRSPEEGNGNSLQYSCLKNPMDRGAWWATAQRVMHVTEHARSCDRSESGRTRTGMQLVWLTWARSQAGRSCHRALEPGVLIERAVFFLRSPLSFVFYSVKLENTTLWSGLPW